MVAHKLLDFWADSEEFLRIIKKIKDGYRKLSVRIPEGSQRGFFLAGLWRSLPGKSMVVLTAGSRDGDKLFGDLQAFLGEDRVLFFSQPDLYPYEEAEPSLNVAQERVEVLKSLASKEPVLVVAPLQATLYNTAPYDRFLSNIIQVKNADILDVREFVEKLVGAGYERTSLVEKKGQLSVRGGIIDIFPLTEEQPVRIEFFGDEVDSIRYFDILTQKSTDEIEGVTISPASELLLSTEEIVLAADAIERDVDDLVAAMKKKGDKEREKQVGSKYNGIIEKIRNGIRFPGIGQFAPYFYEQAGNLFDYLQDDSIVVMLEPDNLYSHFEASEREMNDIYLEMLEQGQLLASQNKVYFSLTDLSTGFAKKMQVDLTSKLSPDQGIPQFEIETQNLDSFQDDTSKLLNKLVVWQEDKARLFFMLSTGGRARRLKEILEEANIEIVYQPDGENPLSPDREILVGNLSNGFVFPEAKIVILTDSEIFGNVRRRRKRKTKLDNPAIHLDELRVGDYVVHSTYGVCVYRGIGVTEFAGVQKEYLHFEFAANDKLYVPVEQIGLIQPYFGFESDRPKLSKLGGSEWNKARKKVKSAVREIAGELLKLYAQREIEGGNAFSKDTPWQQEFEEAFPYEETPDQLKAIQDVKKDMESRMPMDRLVCGDVGYGKTEVAVRAAFKAVMDGKQVAVLVPTTILAQQHYNTFKERFAGYPIAVDVLSRFKTAAEQKKTIKALENGKVDIVIGTHRLVQKDIKFKELGLLIVDEEQRFGVSHKEKLKQLRKNVDVLTLTATPIPRTLHMALAGVRDMSVIETPPEERFPIRTHVIERNDNIIREAILRELNREGQVYYVHNRIETIDRVAEGIKKLVPKANIAVAHGQMDEMFLERIMLDFAAGKYDILVCTTIIETGLDIPNVNTIIIDHADKMGLSQLYQLRGRVGRTNRIAYAYLATQPDRVRTEVAEKRLDAIKEFTQLGSGFKIALRDLEIRGAGNLLGAEQHGHIAAVGFDLYCSMLEDAVKELKGEKKVITKDVVIELPIEAYIPDIYMADTRQKITLYRRLASIVKLDELSDLRKEVYDRYGDIPDQLERLFRITELKIYAGQVGIINFVAEEGRVILRFTPEEEMLAEKATKMFEVFPRQIAFVPGEVPAIAVKTDSMDQDKILFTLKRVLKTIAD